MIKNTIVSKHEKELKQEHGYGTPEYISVVVSDPVTHELEGQKYTTYLVSTKTTLKEYKKKEFAVRRRYNDFQWLRDTLLARIEEQPPTKKITSLAPLPGKPLLAMFGDTRFQPEFIEERRAGLEKFINSVANHTFCRFQKELHRFLEEQDALS